MLSILAGVRRSPECSYWHWYRVELSLLIFHINHLRVFLQISIRDCHVIRSISTLNLDNLVILFQKTTLLYSHHRFDVQTFIVQGP